MKQNILQKTSHGIGIFLHACPLFGASTTICWVSRSLCIHGMVDMLKLIVTTCKLKMWKKGCQPNTISSTSYVVFASHFSIMWTKVPHHHTPSFSFSFWFNHKLFFFDNMPWQKLHVVKFIYVFKKYFGFFNQNNWHHLPKPYVHDISMYNTQCIH